MQWLTIVIRLFSIFTNKTHGKSQTLFRFRVHIVRNDFQLWLKTTIEGSYISWAIHDVFKLALRVKITLNEDRDMCCETETIS